MSIVEFDGPPFWSLQASKTGESTKYPWVGVVEGMAGRKNFTKEQPIWFSFAMFYVRALQSNQ